jgi:hypothetical protein
MAIIALYRVRVVSSGWLGGPGVNTFYFQPNNDGNTVSAEGAQSCVDRVHSAFVAMANIFSSSTTFTVSPDVDVLQDETGTLSTTFSVTPPAAVVGASPAGYAPLPAMLLMRLRTSTVNDGSTISGRAFLGPVGQGNDLNGTPADSARTLVLAGGAALFVGGVDADPRLAVWRRPRDADATRKTPSARTARVGLGAAVTSITAPDKFGVLTSRRD